MTIFPPGTQVAYVPTHAKGDVNHQDADWGFSQEQRGGLVLCRFWAKDRKHQHQIGDMRTKANAVGVEARHLIPHQHCRQELIDNYLRVRGAADLSQRKMWGMLPGARKMR